MPGVVEDNAPGLDLGGIAGLQCGAALTTRLFPAVGPAGVVTLRLFIAAVVLVAAWRPGLRWNRGTWALVAGAGTLIAIHHLSYYEALDRIPLGAATTVEFSGPFLIAPAGSRRATDALWTCLAAAGVLLLTDSGHRLSAAGLGFAALAGCCWGGYILVARRLARHVPDGRGLALAVAWGAALSLPYGLAQGGTRLFRPEILALGAAVAILSTVLPYSLQFEALRRLSGRVFSVLTSLEPAVGALAGLLLLNQRLSLLQWLGMTAVALASIGASRGTDQHGSRLGGCLAVRGGGRRVGGSVEDGQWLVVVDDDVPPEVRPTAEAARGGRIVEGIGSRVTRIAALLVVRRGALRRGAALAVVVCHVVLLWRGDLL
jgi:inner membrane transporter RhtA